jgi:hypothetical protein
MKGWQAKLIGLLPEGFESSLHFDIYMKTIQSVYNELYKGINSKLIKEEDKKSVR